MPAHAGTYRQCRHMSHRGNGKDAHCPGRKLAFTPSARLLLIWQEFKFTVRKLCTFRLPGDRTQRCRRCRAGHACGGCVLRARVGDAYLVAAAVRMFSFGCEDHPSSPDHAAITPCCVRKQGGCDVHAVGSAARECRVAAPCTPGRLARAQQ